MATNDNEQSESMRSFVFPKPSDFMAILQDRGVAETYIKAIVLAEDMLCDIIPEGKKVFPDNESRSMAALAIYKLTGVAKVNAAANLVLAKDIRKQFDNAENDDQRIIAQERAINFHDGMMVLYMLYRQLYGAPRTRRLATSVALSLLITAIWVFIGAAVIVVLVHAIVGG